jgi:hypothetical protein
MGGSWEKIQETKNNLGFFFGQEAVNFCATNRADTFSYSAAFFCYLDLAVCDRPFFTTFYTITFEFHCQISFRVVMNKWDLQLASGIVGCNVVKRCATRSFLMSRDA